jgi:hypothetical protein
MIRQPWVCLVVFSVLLVVRLEAQDQANKNAVPPPAASSRLDLTAFARANVGLHLNPGISHPCLVSCT